VFNFAVDPTGLPRQICGYMDLFIAGDAWMCCKACCVQASCTPLQSTALLTRDKILSSAHMLSRPLLAAALIATSHPVGRGEIKAMDPCTRFAVGSILLMTTGLQHGSLALGERH